MFFKLIKLIKLKFLMFKSYRNIFKNSINNKTYSKKKRYII